MDGADVVKAERHDLFITDDCFNMIASVHRGYKFFPLR
jgi:hypothetical protein